MVNELLGIQYNIAKANVTDRKVQNLAAYINEDSLRAIHRTMDKNKASGVDKVTKEEYEQNLEENLENLVKRMKNGSYRPNPTRRVYIPKETKGKIRPLGISSYEDKLVENAIAQILEQIYEPKFYNVCGRWRGHEPDERLFPDEFLLCRPAALRGGPAAEPGGALRRGLLGTVRGGEALTVDVLRLFPHLPGRGVLGDPVLVPERGQGPSFFL